MFGLSNLPVIDAHVHLKGALGALVNGEEIMEATKCSAMNIVCVPHLTNETSAVLPIGLLFKARNPGRVYLFAGLRYPPGGISAHSKTDFAEQVDRYVRMGADGIKMHEGKPTVRRETGVPLDAPAYDAFYQTVEERQVPVVFHVGDPWIFWNVQTAPEYAHERGWVYSDGSAPDNESLFAEAESVLNKFPRLRIIFAHFYFMSNDRHRADEFLERWPSVSFDLTPGVEMFPNFTADWDGWRDFFVKHQDRIIFGTDIVGEIQAPDPANVAKALYRTYCVRNFLETDHRFRTWDSVSRGFALEEAPLRKIYHDNFTQYAGSAPREMNFGVVLEECERVAILATGASREIQSVLHSVVAQVETMAL